MVCETFKVNDKYTPRILQEHNFCLFGLIEVKEYFVCWVMCAYASFVSLFGFIRVSVYLCISVPLSLGQLT